jgi:hypothetical protein
MRKNLQHLIVLASIAAPAALFGGAATITAITTEGCGSNPPNPQQIQAITQAGAQELECVATAALNGGISDPAIIATMCGGLTIATVVGIVDILLTGSAGAPALEAGVLVDAAARAAIAMNPRLFNFTAAERSTLTTLRNRAAALLASGSAK